MTKNLSPSDYKLILTHYGHKIPKKIPKKTIKKRAENLIARKLCACVKKVSKTLKNKNKNKNKNKQRSIGICVASILKNRGMKYSKFSCKKKRKITNLRKTRKINFIPFRKRRS